MRGGDVSLRLAGAGQKPYQGLLIGVTLAIVVGSPQVKLIRRYGEAAM